MEIIQPTKKAKGKCNEIIEELIWTKTTREIAELHQIGEDEECRENYGLKVECIDRCTSKEQCKKQENSEQKLEISG